MNQAGKQIGERRRHERGTGKGCDYIHPSFKFKHSSKTSVQIPPSVHFMLHFSMSARKDIHSYEYGFRFFNNIIFENFHGKCTHSGGDDVRQYCELFDAAGALAGGAKGDGGRNIS